MASISHRSAALMLRRANFILLALYSYNSTMCQGPKKEQTSGVQQRKEAHGAEDATGNG